MCVSKPKVPAPTPVIERQAYRDPTPRSSIGGEGDTDRRRRIAGMATSPQGLTTEASTTKRVRMGGDESINPSLSSPTASTAPVSLAQAATAALTPRPRRQAQTRTPASTPGFFGARPRTAAA